MNNHPILSPVTKSSSTLSFVIKCKPIRRHLNLNHLMTSAHPITFHSITFFIFQLISSHRMTSPQLVASFLILTLRISCSLSTIRTQLDSSHSIPYDLVSSDVVPSVVSHPKPSHRLDPSPSHHLSSQPASSRSICHYFSFHLMTKKPSYLAVSHLISFREIRFYPIKFQSATMQ